MPSSHSRATLARHWELLKRLPTKPPGMITSEIRQVLKDAGHQASKRTIERDLVELSRIFPLQCNDKGTPYGWHWAPGQSLALPGISISEALSITLLESSLRTLMPQFMLADLAPRFEQAKQKLEALARDNSTARWPHKVAYLADSTVLQPPQVNSAIAATLQQALIDNVELLCIYQSASKQTLKTLHLGPLALVQRGHTRYLLATREGYADIRQYALHRFRSAAPLAEKQLGGIDFDLQAYLAQNHMQFGVRGCITLHAWVSDQLAHLLGETPLSSDMRITPCSDSSGSVLYASVTDSWELRWWLLSHAGSVVVYQPKQLREDLQLKLEKAVMQYNNRDITKCDEEVLAYGR